ncbi:hypothetical protein AGMMS50218_05810 [Actinomycetota bacterium]|nr:hypothetical protein AGMMS50218_05810 [Actinomycetota bacterium]
MGAQPRGMQQVELVDGHGAATGGVLGPGLDGSAPPEPPGLRRGLGAWSVRVGRGLWRHRRRWPLLVAGLAVLSLVWGGVRVVQWRHEQAYLASVVDVPGLLAPVDPSATELWRAEVGGFATQASWSVVRGAQLGAGQVGDVLVGAGFDAEGPRLVGVDAATGEVRWQWHAEPTGLSFEAAMLGQPVCSATTAPLLVCWDGRYTAADPTTAMGGLAQSLLVLDPATGEQLQRRDDIPPWSADVVVGPDVVIAVAQDDGGVLATRYDPATWTQRWSTTVPPDHAALDDLGILANPSLVVDRDDVVVAARTAGVVRLSGAAGVVLPTSSAPAATGELTRFFSAADDAVFGFRYDEIGAGETFALGSTETWPGYWWPAGVDDGSLGTVLLQTDGDLSLLRPGRETGWSSPAETPGVEAWVLRGRVVTFDGTALTVRDGRDGSVQWTDKVTPAVTDIDVDGVHGVVVTSILTDTRSLLVVEAAPGQPADDLADADAVHRVLVAYSLDDGTRSWDVDLPAGTMQVMTAGGLLLAQTTGGELVRLG